MSEQNKAGLYIDIDGTMFKSSLLEKVIERGVAQSVFASDAFEEAAKIRRQWQYNNGEDVYSLYIHSLVRGFVQQMAGVAVDRFDEIVRDVVETHSVRKFRFPRILMGKLEDSHDNIAISGSPERVAKTFLGGMMFLRIIGSHYEVNENNTFTGSATATPDKAAVRGMLLDEGIVRAVGDVAVGDTMGDKTILSAVEFPIMFNPSATLAKHGKTVGWPIVLEQKDNITVLEASHSRNKGGEYGYFVSELESLLVKINSLQERNAHQGN